MTIWRWNLVIVKILDDTAKNGSDSPTTSFLDAFSHLYKRARYIRPSVRRSVGPSVRRSVRPQLFSDATRRILCRVSGLVFQWKERKRETQIPRRFARKPTTKFSPLLPPSSSRETRLTPAYEVSTMHQTHAFQLVNWSIRLFTLAHQVSKSEELAYSAGELRRAITEKVAHQTPSERSISICELRLQANHSKGNCR